MCYMCHMNTREDDERKVGVRELWQNLSVYLGRVERRERLEVIDHARLVAVLAPTGEPAGALERLVATGRVVPPSGSLLDSCRRRARPSTRVSEALAEERAERL
jgi:antitoxin (DNA-binding transcriptional repressor) of toxin-antitoxin stability system